MEKMLRKTGFLLLFTSCIMACSDQNTTSDNGNEATPTVSDFKRNTAVYITMPDGVRIAVDIWLPEAVKEGVQVPTMMMSTRYWRAAEIDPPVPEPNSQVDFFNNNDFAFVIVDVRGTGASFGTRQSEFTVAETLDFDHITNWISDQKWSNGAISTIGVSYSGNTAENAIYGASKPLKAAIPRFVDFDVYSSILFPGGLQNLLITSDWGKAVRALDLNDAATISPPSEEGPRLIGVKPVDEDRDRTMLAQAVSDHVANPLVTEIFGPMTFRDDIKLAMSLDGSGGQVVSPHNFKAEVEKQAIPAYHWGSWMDAGTAAGVLARFASYEAPMRYVIGPWSHGAGHDVDPYNDKEHPVSPTVEEQYFSIIKFLEPLTASAAKPTATSKELFYFTFGEGKWKKTTSWPPEGTEFKRFYFASGGLLKDTAPEIEEAADQYQVNFETGSGDETRWDTQLGGKDVFYGDRAKADKLNLVYTSAPLEQDMEFTGHGVVHLNMSSTKPDGAVIVYIEDVAPDGKVTMITEGHLRLRHRKISDDEPPYPMFGPYHSFKRKDVSLMIPGEIAEIAFALLPTSVLLKKGHSIRVAIAGHDKDTFLRIPDEGTPEYSFYRQAGAASYIEIPLIKPGSSNEADDPFMLRQ